MDGFNVLLSGNTMIVKYHGEIMLADVHKGNFEVKISEMIEDIVSYLKKEYKKITGNALTLKKIDKEPSILVQSMSKIRSWVQADCKYEIGGIPAEPELGSSVEERLDNSIKKWLGMGEPDKANRRYNVTPMKGQKQYPGTKKPQNVKGKRDEEPRG
jgi:predicted transcriptional regulator